MFQYSNDISQNKNCTYIYKCKCVCVCVWGRHVCNKFINLRYSEISKIDYECFKFS